MKTTAKFGQNNFDKELPPKIDNDRYKVWLDQAYYDLDISQISLHSGFFEWAAYQAEQAAEKALKSVIVHAGWRPPKMHKLGMLFGMCNQANSKFRETKFNFRHLESFTFISRYPFLIPGKNQTPHELITNRDASLAVKEARAIVTGVKKILEGTSLEDEASSQIIEEQYFTQDEINLRLLEIKESLIREFEPEKIILFGSFARETNNPVSGTMDILIIAKTGLSFIDRIVKAREATRGGNIIIEPIIYTPEEFDLMTQDSREGFIESALEEGRIIYERKRLR